MADYVVHEHQDGVSESNSSGFLFSIILLAIVLFLLFFYGLPLLRNSATPQVNVPGRVDVNLNQK